MEEQTFMFLILQTTSIRANGRLQELYQCGKQSIIFCMKKCKFRLGLG